MVQLTVEISIGPVGDEASTVRKALALQHTKITPEILKRVNEVLQQALKELTEPYAT